MVLVVTIMGPRVVLQCTDVTERHNVRHLFCACVCVYHSESVMQNSNSITHTQRQHYTKKIWHHNTVAAHTTVTAIEHSDCSTLTTKWRNVRSWLTITYIFVIASHTVIVIVLPNAVITSHNTVTAPHEIIIKSHNTGTASHLPQSWGMFGYDSPPLVSSW
jgi:hypothetical protein